MPVTTGRTDRERMMGAVARVGATRPDVVLIAPMMAYLVLLGVTDALPVGWLPLGVALRGVGALAVVWVFRHYLPPWGKPHWRVAIVGGAVCAWGWIAGQYLSDHLGLPGRLPLYPGEKSPVDPHDVLGARSLFWATWWLRMSVATIAVPVVEELFWRAFMLRAMISWRDFERVPLGTFSWFAFVGTSLISTLQHPDNWVVSIPCWLAFNAVFYWTRSILCVVLLHGLTNLYLYVLVLRVGDWSFW